jgi:hypothetical protein
MRLFPLILRQRFAAALGISLRRYGLPMRGGLRRGRAEAQREIARAAQFMRSSPCVDLVMIGIELRRAGTTQLTFCVGRLTIPAS